MTTVLRILMATVGGDVDAGQGIHLVVRLRNLGRCTKDAEMQETNGFGTDKKSPKQLPLERKHLFESHATKHGACLLYTSRCV